MNRPSILNIGPESVVVAGQRVSVPTSYAYAPTSYGVQSTGVPQVSPQQPPFIGAANGGGSTSGALEGVGGYGTSGNNTLATQVAVNNPHNLKVSPVWWAIIFGTVGILALNGTSWRKTIGEDASEHAHVGAVSEGAGEKV